MGDSSARAKPRRSKAVRRLVIWYRRNAAVTSLVGTATSSASAAGSVAGTVVSSAGNVAGTVLQPLVFDPLRRLQGGNSDSDTAIDDTERLWVAVDGMGGDHAPGPILEGCLQAIARLVAKTTFQRRPLKDLFEPPDNPTKSSRQTELLFSTT